MIINISCKIERASYIIFFFERNGEISLHTAAAVASV